MEVAFSYVHRSRRGTFENPIKVLLLEFVSRSLITAGLFDSIDDSREVPGLGPLSLLTVG